MSERDEQLPHTPGPWFIDEGWGTGVGRYGVGHYACVIARLHSERDSAPGEQRDGNARLVAAAPSMLEVCRRIDVYRQAATLVPAELASIAEHARVAYRSVVREQSGGDSCPAPYAHLPRYETRRVAQALPRDQVFGSLVGLLEALTYVDNKAASIVLGDNERVADESPAQISRACEVLVDAFIYAVEERVAERVQRQIRKQGASQ